MGPKFEFFNSLELGQLIADTRPFLDLISKARGGQLFKSLLDNFLEIPNALPEKVSEFGNFFFTVRLKFATIPLRGHKRTSAHSFGNH